MTDAVKIALIQFMGTVFASMMAAGAILWGARRVEKSVNGVVTKLTDSKDATIAAQVVTMGVKDERIAAVGAQEHAKGVLEEKDRQESSGNGH
jgi:hypothetical protein